VSGRRDDELPEWVGMYTSGRPDWSVAYRQDRRDRARVRDMSPAEIKVVAAAEVSRRLEAFDAVWEVVISHDPSASANGYGDVLDGSVEGEWYAKGVTETLERIRSLLTKTET
jgi:hypothetical protein